MRIVLFGKTGQVGWELNKTLGPLGEVFAFDLNDLDIRDTPQLVRTLEKIQPQFIVNAAAYTSAEKAESEPDLAMQINSQAPKVMAETAGSIKAVLIHYSTDYVFDGTKKVPYTENDLPSPINHYGKTKLAGERAIQQAGCVYLVLRTSWVYSLKGDNFLTKVMLKARQQKTIHMVSDEIGTPTWACMLAEMTINIMSKCGVISPVDFLRQYAGIYHLAGTGSVSRFEWARAILEHDPQKNNHKTKEIIPIRQANYPTKVLRPLYSALDCERVQTVFNLNINDWDNYLRLALSNA